MRRLALGLVAVSLAGCSGVGPGENIGQSSAAITFPNDQPAYDYFVGKGLTPFQAAGIVGNLDQESGVDPTAVQAGGPGRGIAQWSVGGRWDTDANDNAKWYATMQGQNVDALQLQLDFIWYELTTFSGYGLAKLQATTNVTDATVVFETDFEGCGTCDQSTRISYAETVLAAFGNDHVDAGPVTGMDAGTPCTVTATGESGECMDTATCAALGNHVSTPGYCPGPANIQCCTSNGAPPPVDAGGPADAQTGNDAGTHATGDAGSPPPPPLLDAGPVVRDAGTAPRDATAASADTGLTAKEPDGGSGFVYPQVAPGGCSTSGAPASGNAAWLAAALVVVARRRRRVREAA